MSIKGLAHAAIRAKDYQATIAFYTEVFGFKLGHHWNLPAFRITDASMLISPDGRTCIEVFDNEAAVPAQGKNALADEDAVSGALLHIAFYVDDVDAVYSKALDHGAKPYIEPDNLTLGDPPLVIRSAVIHSPNGEVVEILEDVDFDLSQPK